MKVLLVSISFYPEVSPRSFRATELAKELSRQGISVEVAGVDLTSEEDSLRKEFLSQHRINWQSLGKADWSILAKKWQEKGGIFRLLAKAMGYFLEFPSIEWYFKLPKILRIAEDTTALISIAKPFSVHWGINRLKAKGSLKGICWIADCGDPFMLSTLNVRKIPFYFSFLEKSFCRSCDFLVTPVTDGYRGYYPEFKNKIKVIPQGFNFKEDRKKVGDYIENQQLTFVYAGSFLHKGRNPEVLLKYLSNSTLNFRFYIYTQQKYLVEPHIVKGDLRFQVMDIISRDEMLKTLGSADFVINMMNGTMVQVPSKLIDYFIVDRPVLNIENDQLNGGELSIIDEFLCGNYINRYQFTGMDRYDISFVVKDFLQLIESKNE